MEKKWSLIKKILEKSIPESQAKVWLEPLCPFCAGDAFILYAPSAFTASFVRSRFLEAIHDAARTAGVLFSTIEILHDTQQQASQLAGSRHMQEQPSTGLKNASVSSASPLVCTTPQRATPSERNVPCGSRLQQGNRSENPKAPSLFPRPLPGQEQLGLPLVMPEARGYNYFRSWRHCFDEFVVGDCNELAHAAAKSLCTEHHGTDILYLNSAPGLGKTHLMHSVGQLLSTRSNRETPKVEYVTAEEFTTRFLQSLDSKTVDVFKSRYRNLDLFLLEDVHFLQGKKGTQAELLATINALQARGAKVVFTSSFAPRELHNMDEQLVSRLSGGFVSAIDRPDKLMRQKLFRYKASMHQTALPEDVEDLLAEHISLDVRQIESCLQNLLLKARLLCSRITLDMAWDVISAYTNRAAVFDLTGITAQVCRAFNVPEEKLSSVSRKQEYVTARNMAFYLARKYTDLSLDAIGKHFNRRHSTVLKGITKLEREMHIRSPFGSQASNIIAMIEKNAPHSSRM